MKLDELRVEWLNLKDDITEGYHIRKVDVLAELSDRPIETVQQLNWFRYLKGLPPHSRGYQYQETPWEAEMLKMEVLVEFYTEGRLKEEFMYLEDLYDIVREGI
ncbi:hypothetical protein NVP1101O_047 [Vibrio phage 1.101.O._10N.261.45.C6]|nr:hypothetical protein NVP1101O_047 [Vibrio phage 1.101.O._10N.261.45.C6]